MEASIKRKQKGSALTLIVSLFFIFMMVALVVDAGRLYFEKAQLQTMANGLASDLAENNQACFGERMGSSAPTTISGAKSRLDELYPDNKAQVGFADLAVIETEKSKHTISRAESVTRSNGVSVKLTKEINGLIGFAVDKPLTAGATVKKELVSGIGIDSRTASLDTASSPLLGLVFGEILGKDVTLDLVGLNDLAGTVTDLSDLVAGVGLDNVVNVLNADMVLENVLKSAEGLTGPAVNTLDGIINAAVGNNIVLSDVIQGLGESSVPSGSKVPTLGLVKSIVMNVDGALEKDININLNKSLGIPVVSGLLDALGLSSTTLELSITPTPGFILAAARTDSEGRWPVAESSNVSIEVNVGAGIAFLDLSNLMLNVDTASAKVEIDSAYCAGEKNYVDVNVRLLDRSLLTISANAEVLKVGKISVVAVKLNPVSQDAGSVDGGFKDIDLFHYEETPPATLKYTKPVVLDDLLGELLSGAEICILGPCFPLLGDRRGEGIADLLDGLLSGLVEPLLNGLGISLVPANVTLHSVNQTTALIEKTYE